MLAQLKTVVLIKEATKLASIRPVECLQPQHACVRLQCRNGPKKKSFLLKTFSLILFWDMKVIPLEKLPRNWRSHTTLSNYNFYSFGNAFGEFKCERSQETWNSLATPTLLSRSVYLVHVSMYYVRMSSPTCSPPAHPPTVTFNKCPPKNGHKPKTKWRRTSRHLSYSANQSRWNKASLLVTVWLRVSSVNHSEHWCSAAARC